jgi:hypothetical protein
MLSLGSLPWILVLASVIAGAGGTLWYRGEYESEHAGRIADAAAAAQAVSDKLGEAKSASDAALASLQQQLDAGAKTQTVYVDRIQHDTPSTCAPSDADRDASRFLRDIAGARPARGPAAQ